MTDEDLLERITVLTVQGHTAMRAGDVATAKRCHDEMSDLLLEHYGPSEFEGDPEMEMIDRMRRVLTLIGKVPLQ